MSSAVGDDHGYAHVSSSDSRILIRVVVDASNQPHVEVKVGVGWGRITIYSHSSDSGVLAHLIEQGIKMITVGGLAPSDNSVPRIKVEGPDCPYEIAEVVEEQLLQYEMHKRRMPVPSLSELLSISKDAEVAPGSASHISVPPNAQWLAPAPASAPASSPMSAPMSAPAPVDFPAYLSRVSVRETKVVSSPIEITRLVKIIVSHVKANGAAPDFNSKKETVRIKAHNYIKSVIGQHDLSADQCEAIRVACGSQLPT